MNRKADRRINTGAYTTPFSGVGVEFYPLGLLPGAASFVLHEAGYLPANRHWTFARILSPFWRLYFNFGPGHRIVFPRGECELGSRHIVLIPDHQLFHCQGLTPVPHLWLHFSPARRLAAGADGPLQIDPSATERALLREMREAFEAGAGRGLYSDGLYHLSCALLHRILARRDFPWGESAAEPPGIERAVRMVEQRFREPLSVSDLAREAGMSVSVFSRTFHRVRGVTPVRFLMQVRVREAAGRLVSAADSIEAIAEQAGFCNRDYFSVVFRKVTGEWPAGFRRRHTPASSPPHGQKA